jgi:hypothetical protein
MLVDVLAGLEDSSARLACRGFMGKTAGTEAGRYR